jgi:FixJ family two-component response regulator
MDLHAEPSRRVVLLDDNPAVRESVSMLLKSVGLDTVAYHSPAVFLASPLGDAGCILLDIRMPEMSGLEVHRRLRERGIDTPVIFLTGHGDVSMAVRSMRDGAFDFLEKPVEDQQLIDRVLEALTHDAERRASAARRNDSASRIWLTARERKSRR